MEDMTGSTDSVYIFQPGSKDDLTRHVKIGPMVYAVVEEKGLVDGDKSRKLDGHIRYNDCQIAVEAGMSPQAKRQTIWHEIVHGILTQAGYTKQGETMVDALAYGIMGVLQDNPWLKE